MNFNEHYGVEGKHAFLSPSQYHWMNYDADKLRERYSTWRAAERGTKLHELAANLIELGVRLPANHSTLNMYVNDAIRFRMTPEQPLYFSENCFGTADAISFRRNKLRIHDLKTGIHKASMHQLEVYNAIFCLEYDVDPFEIRTELRIYQNDEVVSAESDPEFIAELMNKIIFFNDIINGFHEE